MRAIRTTAVLAGILWLAPAAFAQTASTKPAQTASTKPAKAMAEPAKTSAAVHATKGVVKSVDDNTLVISKPKARDMTFVLNSSTQKKGTATVGSTVQVRYRTEGKENIATAITVQGKK